MYSQSQGTREPGRRRYQAIPRTLIFLTGHNPQTGAAEILLLKGGPHKRLWANRYNGLGGHVEAGEDVYAAAERELTEETGLAAPSLRLAGVINIATGSDEQGPRPGVLVFVFHGATDVRPVTPSAEGEPQWVALDAYGALPLVEDLHAVIPRVLSGHFFYGSYTPDEEGKLHFTFR